MTDDHLPLEAREFFLGTSNTPSSSYPGPSHDVLITLDFHPKHEWGAKDLREWMGTRST